MDAHNGPGESRRRLLGAAAMLCALLLVPGGPALAQTFGLKKRPLRPDEFGNVTMSNFVYTSPKPIAAVVFPHWLHRMKFTCRLCHADLGFSMNANGTGIKEENNLNGLYCGTCHNGKDAFAPRDKDESGKVVENCERCHSQGRSVTFKNGFYPMTKELPRARFGNRVDWLKAEDAKAFRLKDQIEGLSIKRKDLKMPVDEDINAKEVKMPDIIFSHTKHIVWNGCELCHPELFGVEKGKTEYTMQEIFDGKYCGVCHGKVAFPTADCQLCHLKDVAK